jgi:hypothetical protein
MISLSKPVFRWETVAGDPWMMGDKEIVPLARVISLGWVGMNGGFLLRSIKPFAVVETTDRGSRRIPIDDPTERVIRLIALSVVLPLAWKLVRRIFG